MAAIGAGRSVTCLSCTKALPGHSLTISFKLGRYHIYSSYYPKHLNALYAFVLFVVLLKCVIAGGADRYMLKVGNEFRKAVDEEKLVWLNGYRGSWFKRRDLLDYAIAKDAGFIVRFINGLDKKSSAKESVLAALFEKRPDLVDEVFGRGSSMKIGTWRI